jgi:hypothetical protein
MGRRLSAVVLGVVSALLFAGTAFADTTPGPGHFRDSGDRLYLNSFAYECGANRCTETYVSGEAVDLQHDGSISDACVEQFSYPIRGGARTRDFGLCGDATVNVASDLSSGSLDATLTMTCAAGDRAPPRRSPSPCRSTRSVTRAHTAIRRSRSSARAPTRTPSRAPHEMRKGPSW